MANLNSTMSCVFCNSQSAEKVIIFSEEILKNAKRVLQIRKTHNLKFKDIALPVSVSPTNGYHSRCYKNFSVLMSKYKNDVSTLTGLSSPPGVECTASQPDKKETQSTSNVLKNINFNENASNSGAYACLDETRRSKNQEDTIEILQDKCSFCTKLFRKFKGRQEKLSILNKDALKAALEPFLELVKDSDVYKQLDTAEVLRGHGICRKEYFNSLKFFQQKSETPFHKNVKYHQLAFHVICSFIDDNIIGNKKCYFFSFLCNYYVESLRKFAEEDGNVYENIFSKTHFEDKLRKHYGDELKTTVIHHKKIIGHKDRAIDDPLYSLLEEKDILWNAANILRQKILNIEKLTLPEDLKMEDLMRGECSVPQLLKGFYVTVLAGSYSKRRKSIETERLSNSLAEDSIYNVTKGRIKTSKHITLAMTLKSLTSSRKVVEIINRYGHCCSYHVTEELETESTFASCNQSSLCPEGIVRSEGLHTGVAFDNFDRFVDTASGKDTLHDTVGIMYQDIVNTPSSEHDISVGEEVTENHVNENTDPESSGSQCKRVLQRVILF